jgi:ribosomal protein S15P/S13E
MRVSDLPNWFKVTAASVSLVAAIVGGVIAAEDRYVDQQEAAKSLEQLEYRQNVQFNMIRYDFLDERYYKLRDYLRQNPDDLEAKRELDNLEARRAKLRKDLGLE